MPPTPSMTSNSVSLTITVSQVSYLNSVVMPDEEPSDDEDSEEGDGEDVEADD